MVIAAGSVIKDPRRGPMVRMESHHANGVFPPNAANRERQLSAKRRMGLELAMAMMTKTKIGSATVVFPFVSIGLAPQDLKYAGEETATEIGERNQIRESVTIHRGTVGGGGVTRIGDDNLFMAQSHVAHDCQLGNEIIMANGATLAGHVEIADRASIGAYSGVHQSRHASARPRSSVVLPVPGGP